MPLATRVIAGAALAGCAGTPAAAPRGTGAMQTVAVSPDIGPVAREGGLLTLTRPDGTVAESFAVPPGPALDALRAAYEANGVAVTLWDPAAGRVGTTRLVVQQTLGRAPLSRYLRCGESVTGPRADTDRVVVSLVSTVTAGPGGQSDVRTTLVAHARDMSGGSGDAQACATTGVLEALLHAHARRPKSPT